MIRRGVVFRAALLATCFAVGCAQSGMKTFEVSGTVTWNGQPVPVGMVRFEPDTKAGNSGPATVAMIKSGSYSTPADRGVVGGKYRVIISGNDGVPIEVPGEGMTLTHGRPLFLDIVQEVDLPRDSTVRDFHLTKP